MGGSSNKPEKYQQYGIDQNTIFQRFTPFCQKLQTELKSRFDVQDHLLKEMFSNSLRQKSSEVCQNIFENNKNSGLDSVKQIEAKGCSVYLVGFFKRKEDAFGKALAFASQDLINVQLYYLTHMYQKQEILNVHSDKPERQIDIKDSKTLSNQEKQTVIWETKLVYDQLIFQVANNFMNLLLQDINHEIDWEIKDQKSSSNQKFEISEDVMVKFIKEAIDKSEIVESYDSFIGRQGQQTLIMERPDNFIGLQSLNQDQEYKFVNESMTQQDISLQTPAQIFDNQTSGWNNTNQLFLNQYQLN